MINQKNNVSVLKLSINWNYFLAHFSQSQFLHYVYVGNIDNLFIFGENTVENV